MQSSKNKHAADASKKHPAVLKPHSSETSVDDTAADIILTTAEIIDFSEGADSY